MSGPARRDGSDRDNIRPYDDDGGWMDDLLSPPQRLSSGEIADEALQQMGEGTLPGYAAHRRRQYERSDVSGLAENLGLS